MMILLNDEWHQRHHPCPLNRDAQLSLMLGAYAASAAWGDLAIGGNKASQRRNILIINIIFLLDAKMT